MLKINNLSLKFSDTLHPAVQHINYDVEKGDIVILLGNNGSGKSSLLKLITRNYAPTTGYILLANQLLNSYSEKELSKKIATLTQNCLSSLFPSLTLYENYLIKKQTPFTSTRLEREFIQEYLLEYNANLSTKLDLPVKKLSGGEAQTLTLALCLLNPPSLLLLDEHTSALDPKTSKQLMALTQQKIIEHQLTCIITTHDLELALNYGNRLIFLNSGTIQNVFDGEEKTKLSKQDLLDSYLFCA